MGMAFCRNFVTLLLMSSLNITGHGFVSSEELGCEDMIAMMKPGVTVVRGRDWQWMDQDGTPPTQGTVLGPSASNPGWFDVKWASGREVNYRMGAENKCDLKIVQHNNESTVSSTPSTTPVSTSTTPVSTSTPPLPTCHQCTCSKEMSESEAKTDAEAAELCKEASRLAVEAGKLSVETARVALEAATSRAKVEEAERLIELETKKIELETKKIELETKKVVLEAAKSVAKAEEGWATNDIEQLQFERARRSKTLESL